MIHKVSWSVKQSRATLGALKTIATLHGTVPAARPEWELIEGVRVNILGQPRIGYEKLDCHTRPEQLAALMPQEEHRERAAQLIALMPFAVRPYLGSKTYIAEQYLNALGIDLHSLEDFLGARCKQSRSMEYCALRKMGRGIFPHKDEQGIDRELLKLVEEASGDQEQLARYKALKGYPKGSLGRSFWDFYAQFNWPLPGDPLWVSEDLTVRHDLIHILCDYDISIYGEFLVSAFVAGNSQRFNWMIAMLGFTPPYVSTGAQFRAADFFTAYRRGLNASKSLVDHWDFWPMMEHQVGDLRRECFCGKPEPEEAGYWNQSAETSSRVGNRRGEPLSEPVVLPVFGEGAGQQPRFSQEN